MCATCVPRYVPCGDTGLSQHGDPVFLHFCPLNQNLIHVRTGGGGGSTHSRVRQVVIRWVKMVLFTSVYFFRLDSPLFPGLLGKLDVAVNGYWSMLYVEDNYHNPLKRTFLAYLCYGSVPWDQTHPLLGAMMLVFMESGDRGIRHISRARRRWWLAVTLALNPSVRRLRKHALFPPQAPLGAAGKAKRVVRKCLSLCVPQEAADIEAHDSVGKKEAEVALDPKAERKRILVHSALFVVFLGLIAGWLVILILLKS